MGVLKKYFYLLTGLAVFAVYLITLAPTVIQIDSGELAAVQATLGIAHPTGYPLFTLMGYLFTLIPLPFRDIYKLNILAALWCAGGVSVFTYTVKLVLDNINKFRIIKENIKPKKKKKHSKQNTSKGIEIKEAVSNTIIIPENKKYFAAITAGLILAFSRTYWFQSTSVEVYSLHIFLLSFIILFLVKAFIEENTGQILSGNWIFFSLFLALGFTNHMTTLLIIPGVAYLYFTKFGLNESSIKRILKMLLIFLPVLIIFYLYLPVRASQNPVLNWGNPIDMERIIRHISGKQYQVWLFSSTEAAKKQFVYFINTLPLEFSINLFAAFIGLIYSFIISRKFGIFIIISFIFTVLYSINYDISDIDAYFLLAYFSISFFAAIGIVKLLTFIKFKNISYSVAAALIALFIVIQFVLVYPKVDQSNTYTYEDYTKEVLGGVTENAIIFSYQWDYFLSASYYLQFVENFRRDVAVVDKELLRRSWYFNQLNTAYPGILDGIETEIRLFLNALTPFERDEPYDGMLLENLFRRMMTNFVKANIDRADFYVAPEIFEKEMKTGEFTLPEGYTLVPDLFLFKVSIGNEYIPAADPDFNIRFPEKRDRYLDIIEKSFICPMLIRRALYEMQFDKVDRAEMYINKIKNDFPDYVIPPGIEQALKR